MGAEPDDLELMPRAARDKLNLVGIKVHLRDWRRFSLAERRQLVNQLCHSEGEIELYRAVVEGLVRKYTGRPPERLKRSGDR